MIELNSKVRRYKFAFKGSRTDTVLLRLSNNFKFSAKMADLSPIAIEILCLNFLIGKLEPPLNFLDLPYF